MAAARPSVEALLAAARADFAERLPSKVAEIERLLSEGAWDEARRAAHKLRGSAATYGFSALSTAAAAIEDGLLAAKGAPPPEVRSRLEQIVRGASIEAETAAAGNP